MELLGRSNLKKKGGGNSPEARTKGKRARI
jgi:hypothetical protein